METLYSIYISVIPTCGNLTIISYSNYCTQFSYRKVKSRGSKNIVLNPNRKRLKPSTKIILSQWLTFILFYNHKNVWSTYILFHWKIILLYGKLFMMVFTVSKLSYNLQLLPNLKLIFTKISSIKHNYPYYSWKILTAELFVKIAGPSSHVHHLFMEWPHKKRISVDQVLVGTDS